MPIQARRAITGSASTIAAMMVALTTFHTPSLPTAKPRAASHAAAQAPKHVMNQGVLKAHLHGGYP